jgi:predicted N-acetyltransferase YhbS
MEISIRPEEPKDYDTIAEVIKAAFKKEPKSDHDEQDLVARLRKTDDYLNELSLVAFDDDDKNDKLIGHIMVSKSKIIDKDQEHLSLTLAPLSILPDYQKKGVGTKLVIEAILLAKQAGYESMNVLGQPDYYPKFNFKPAQDFNIKVDFKTPKNALMVLELQDNALKNVSGTIKYSPAFFAEDQ